MREMVRSFLPAIMEAVDIGDRRAGEHRIVDVGHAAEVLAVHLADRRVVTDAERTHATVPAEEVLVPARIEQVLGHLALSGEEAEYLRARHRHPETRPPADGAVASTLLLRLGSFWFGIFFGICVYISMKRQFSQYQRNHNEKDIST